MNTEQRQAAPVAGQREQYPNAYAAKFARMNKAKPSHWVVVKKGNVIEYMGESGGEKKKPVD